MLELLKETPLLISLFGTIVGGIVGYFLKKQNSGTIKINNISKVREIEKDLLDNTDEVLKKIKENSDSILAINDNLLEIIDVKSGIVDKLQKENIALKTELLEKENQIKVLMQRLKKQDIRIEKYLSKIKNE